MGGQVSSLDEVHVVIVGGGFGGIAAAQQLKSRRISFTLIDMRDSFHHNVAALRAAVKPGFAVRTFIPYGETFGDSFVQGRVQRVDTERQTVVLQGGRVVLVHSRIGLCDPELLPSVRQEAKEVLLGKGVELLLGQKVSNLSQLQLNVTQKNTVVTTERGDKLTTDLIVCCTGGRVNAAAYASSFSGCLAADGALKVNDHMQVEGNVTMLLAMGHDDGVGQFNGLKLPRCVVALGKSRDLLLWKSWREMQQKQPI
ncbi:hypothetical protein PFLUV_G00219000 [Perca fluviatilis]|uniref:Ferroptosis suppressor protein 1 n=1 Tax=Perca fluviatilis TaxID=8168 RepID=A0A6A5E976_PERFL|nr:hypothetical protein PFLUV_G00219000 [Perca fluviatilis]